jgi:uncharacterized protein (DUF1778 family)
MREKQPIMPMNNSQEIQVVPLSTEDQRAFAETILKPPLPNDVMKRAASAYRNLIKNDR